MYANKYGVCQNANYPLTSSSKGKTVNIIIKITKVVSLWIINKLNTQKKWVLSWNSILKLIFFWVPK